MSSPHDASESASRYVVGIDLGTTNSAVAYVDTRQDTRKIEVFPIAQITDAGEWEERDTLSSCHYEPAEAELASNALRLPWQETDPGYSVGAFARFRGDAVPDRLIASAKSWLCHGGVDRTAPLLPWQGAPDAARLSPVEASGRILRQMREAWDFRHADAPLAEQDVVLTLPASFDEVARELTVRAAKQAGLPRVSLVEEPQAAFYAWLDRQGADWEQAVQPGETILVCDIGGGTTDFTLIFVKPSESAEGKIHFQRIAVGPHLILGGDNLDLALARYVEPRLAVGGQLSPRQWGTLVHACRRAKELALGASPPDDVTITLPGASSRIVGGSRSVTLPVTEIRELLLEGFLPHVDLDARPAQSASGFREFGLPYAPDAGMTRYLAAFLRQSHAALPNPELSEHDSAVRPDHILFNGGFFASPVLRSRLVEAVSAWFGSDDVPQTWTPQVLENERLDLAVARGAAYFGMARRGTGIKIQAGLARSYYVGVSHAEGQSAVCLLPHGTETEQPVEIERPLFQVRIREPVEFPLYHSSTRLTDQPGNVVPVDQETFTPLPPIRTVLQAGRKTAGAESVPVRLFGRLTEIGTLEFGCREAKGSRQWQLQFDVRAATETDQTGHVGTGEASGFLEQDTVAACLEIIAQWFGDQSKPAVGDPAPSKLLPALEQASQMRRGAWPVSLLRTIADGLMRYHEGRKKSAQHESRWLYLLGYCLRPGFGFAADDWRVDRVWRYFQNEKLRFPSPASRIDSLILWRRVAAGLTAGQQSALANPLLSGIAGHIGKKASRKGRGSGAHESAEILRLVGSLELLPVQRKIEVAQVLLKRLPREENAALRGAAIWSLGRLGSRVPLHGPLNAVVPIEEAETWIRGLMHVASPPAMVNLALMQLARRTDDRFRDIDPGLREEVEAWLETAHAPPHYRAVVEEYAPLESEEQDEVFGESLPPGLCLA